MLKEPSFIHLCGNVNWAKRLKCNVCNTNKPGQNECGGGRGGGYKELDEQELEETKRRRVRLKKSLTLLLSHIMQRSLCISSLKTLTSVWFSTMRLSTTSASIPSSFLTPPMLEKEEHASGSCLRFKELCFPSLFRLQMNIP
ncbi:unnamed protein product, partial [Brassica napus]